MSQVNRKGEKPASSPALDAELRRLKSAAKRAPSEADAPPLSTFPGRKAFVHEEQETLSLHT